MRIVKDPPSMEWKAEVTCRTCKAVLEVEMPDLLYHDVNISQSVDPRERSYWYVRCVVCASTVAVAVPADVAALKERRLGELQR